MVNLLWWWVLQVVILRHVSIELENYFIKLLCLTRLLNCFSMTIDKRGSLRWSLWILRVKSRECPLLDKLDSFWLSQRWQYNRHKRRTQWNLTKEKSSSLINLNSSNSKKKVSSSNLKIWISHLICNPLSNQTYWFLKLLIRILQWLCLISICVDPAGS